MNKIQKGIFLHTLYLTFTSYPPDGQPGTRNLPVPGTITRFIDSKGLLNEPEVFAYLLN